MLRILFLGILVFCLASCAEENAISSILSDNTSSTSFDVSDGISFAGEQGTQITIESGSLVYAKDGTAFNGQANIELVEALDTKSTIGLGLSMQSETGLLTSGGMIKILLTDASGKKLRAKENLPIKVSVPTNNYDARMQRYRGRENKDGTIDWVDPKPLKRFLTKVPIAELDFLPTGFHNAAKVYFAKKKLAYTPERTDSLYYTLYHNFNRGFESDLLAAKLPNGEPVELVQSIELETGHDWPAGMNPLAVFFLKKGPFQDTYIATEEFAYRMRNVLPAFPQEKVWELYLELSDGPLYKADSTLLGRCNNDNLESHYGRIIPADVINELEQLVAVEEVGVENPNLDFDALNEWKRNEGQKEFDAISNAVKAADTPKLSNKAQKQKKAYTQKVVKREVKRMTSYNFEIQDGGWINLDFGIAEKDWSSREIIATVSDDGSFDLVRVYAVFPFEKSMIRLVKKGDTYTSRITDGNSIPVPKSGPMHIVAVGFDPEMTGFKRQATNLGDLMPGNIDVAISIAAMREDEIEKELAKYDSWGEEYGLNADIEVAAYEFEEMATKDALKQNRMFLNPLYLAAAGKAIDASYGEKLFQGLCASCHHPGQEVIVAPGLGGWDERMSLAEALVFTKNPKEAYNKFEYSHRMAEKYVNSFGWMQNIEATDLELMHIFGYLNEPVGY